MKKVLSLTMTIMLLLAMLCIPSVADANVPVESVTAYVTISDKDGNLVLQQEAISVTDIDRDGKLTINDALYLAHEAKYEGGAEAGYASSVGQYGRSIDKLWGTANGGAYGYYLNHISCSNLDTELTDGGYVNAFVYTDLNTWSDQYSYFDINTATIEKNGTLTLTLKYAGYDDQWNPVVLPVAGATILLNGTETAYKTDADGKVTVTLDQVGALVVSAKSATMTLVPPVCKVMVTGDETPVTPTADNENESDTVDSKTVTTVCVVAAVIIAIGAIAAVIAKKKNGNEK